MCNGEFLQKDPDEAIEYLDDLVEKAHTRTGPSTTEIINRSWPIGNTTSTGIYHLREEDDLRAKVDALTKELKIFRARDSKLTQNASHVESLESCFVYGGTDHPAQEYATYAEMRGVYEEHYNTLGTYQKPYFSFSKTYNPSWRNHPNLS